MKTLNVVISDQASEVLKTLKTKWSCKNLSEVVDKLATEHKNC